MIKIGLTGGICCGKSTVSKTFILNNIPIVDADVIARQVVEPGKPAYNKLIETFGKEFILPDFSLDRIKFGKFIFNDKTQLLKLNSIMIQFIVDEANKQFSDLYDLGFDIIAYDAALLIETGNYINFKPVVVVHCPKEVQLQRLMKRNNLSEKEALNIISSQLSNEDKIKVADFSIDSSGSIEQNIIQTNLIIEKIKGLK